MFFYLSMGVSHMADKQPDGEQIALWCANSRMVGRRTLEKVKKLKVPEEAYLSSHQYLKEKGQKRRKKNMSL